MLIYGICVDEIKNNEIDWDKVEKLLSHMILLCMEISRNTLIMTILRLRKNRSTGKGMVPCV